jgi:aldose 1-epimerase
MDFTAPHRIGERIGQVPGGYDHNYVLSHTPGESGLAAVLYDSVSGRKVEVYTTQPGLQVYTGNFLDGTLKGRKGTKYEKNWGVCLETQHFPDSPNQPSFPNAILRPGERFHEETLFRFSVQ